MAIILGYIAFVFLLSITTAAYAVFLMVLWQIYKLGHGTVRGWCENKGKKGAGDAG